MTASFFFVSFFDLDRTGVNIYHHHGLVYVLVDFLMRFAQAVMVKSHYVLLDSHPDYLPRQPGGQENFVHKFPGATLGLRPGAEH